MQERGGFSIDMQWKKPKLARAVITSHQGNVCRLRIGIPVNVVRDIRVVPVTASEDGSLSFPTQAGKTYVVIHQ